jgi:hypothetical protein
VRCTKPPGKKRDADVFSTLEWYSYSRGHRKVRFAYGPAMPLRFTILSCGERQTLMRENNYSKRWFQALKLLNKGFS